MPKPRRKLSAAELQERRRKFKPAELEKAAIEAANNRDASSSGSYCESDDSWEDPEWEPPVAPGPVPYESSDENDHEPMDDFENDLREMTLEEIVEDRDEDPTSDDEATVDSIWTEYEGRHKEFPFTGQYGLQRELAADISPLEVFFLILDDEVIDLLVTETNRFAEQTIASKVPRKYARITKWTPTDAAEMKKFLGLTLWMGLVRLNSLQDYWARQGIYKLDIPRSTMPRNRYQLLLSMLHFCNNETIPAGDRLGKIQPLVDMLQRKFQALFCPGEDIVIDETLVPWRGRLIFRQYIPNKAHRYGIKLFKLCSIDGYTWSLKIYSGKSASGEREVGLAQNVCLQLCGELLNEGRTLYVDNFYTSYELARSMLDKQTHLVGTLRANKKHIPKEVLQAKIKKGEVISREDQNGIVILKWRDTRDVRLLSTKHPPILVPVHPRNTQGQALTNDDQTPEAVDTEANQAQGPAIQNIASASLSQPSTSQTGQAKAPRDRKSRKAKEKPLAILAYNKGKAGIDMSDQMASYATTLRKGVKWYRKLGIELLLGTAIVNAWVLYKHISKQKIQIRAFRESLAADLLNIPGKIQQDRPRTSTSSYHHLSERVNAEGKKIRRKCSGCYSKLQEEAGRKEARNRAKMVYTYCDMCPGQPQICLECFNIKHK